MYNDIGISTWILNNISSYEFLPEICKFLLTINTFGILWVIVIGVFIYLHYKEKNKFDFSYLFMIAPIIIGTFITILIQMWITRAHPYEVIEGFKGESILEYSLPSLSVMISVGVSFILTLKNPDYKIYYYVACFVMAASELILGVSYLSDIIFGAGLGLLFGALGNILNKYVSPLIFKD